MSDAGRKDFSQKLSESMTPDSAKSTQQQVKETVTDAGDRISRGLQPDDSKSGTQETFDKAQRMKDNNNGGAGATIGDKIKDTLGMNNK